MSTFWLVFVFAISWQVLYWAILCISPHVSSSFLKLDDGKGEKGYWAASLVSTVHAFVIVIVCICAVWQEPSLIYSSEFFRGTSLSLLAMQIFLGYIFCDVLISLYYNARWPGWIANMIHHFCVAIVWSQALLGEYAHGVAIVLMTMEFTTPFINLRWFLAKTNKSDGSLYFVNGILMIVMWFIFRIVGYIFAAWLLYNQREGLLSESVPIFNQVVFVTTFLIGFLLMVFWFHKMVTGALKKLRQQAGNAESKPLEEGSVAYVPLQAN